MADHQRRKSWGSYFSLGSITSRSRGSSRQAIRLQSNDDLRRRSPSNLSQVFTAADEPRDAWGAPLATPKPGLPKSPLSQEHTLDRSTSTPVLKDTRSALLSSASRAAESKQKADQGNRRASWLSISEKSKRSLQRMLVTSSRDNSSLSGGHSMISAPTLTSTTNPTVATTEGVRCELLETHSAATIDLRMPGERPVKERVRSPAAEQESKRLEATRERLLRFRAAISSRINHPRTSTDYATTVKLREGVVDGAQAKRRSLRQRSETLSLCKEKIKELTSNARVIKEPVDAEMCLQLSSHENSALLAQAASPGQHEHSGGSSDVHFGSLARSFASSAGKLDFLSSSTSQRRSLLRSRSSGLTDTVTLSDVAKRCGRGTSALPISSPVPTLVGPESQVLSRSALLPQRAATIVETSTTGPSYFSFEQSRIVPATKPVSRYPTGVNPLAMYPDVNAFAPDLRQRTSIVRKPDDRLVRTTPYLNRFDAESRTQSSQVTPTPRIEINGEEEEEDLESLEDVPIFSPSSGELSQYSNKKSSQTATAPMTPTPHGLSATNTESIGRGAQQETPTRARALKSTHSNSTPIRALAGIKSRLSSTNLFHRSKSQRAMKSPMKQDVGIQKSRSERTIQKEDIGTPSPGKLERVSGFKTIPTPHTSRQDDLSEPCEYTAGMRVEPIRVLTKKDENQPLVKSTSSSGHFGGNTLTTPSKAPPVRPKRSDEQLGAQQRPGDWI